MLVDLESTRALRAPAVALALAFGHLGADAVQATNGYLIHGIGTRSKALAGAGVALPQDALAAGVNPAGMAWVGKRFDAGLAIFNPNREYTVSGSPSGFPGTFGLLPGTVESDAEYFFVPNFGANWEVGSNGAFGLSIYGQGGMNTEWPTSTFFGTSPTGVDLSQLFVVPTYAWKFGSGRHSLGISPILAFQTFEARGLQAFASFSAAPAQLSNNSHDQSLGFGGRVGYLGQWTDSFSFGLAYQSEVGMEEFDDYAGLFANRGDFDIPSNYTAGIAYRFGNTAVLALDLQEIMYTDVDSVANPLFPNLLAAPLGAPGAAGFGWEDMTVVKLGVQWGMDPWTWRVGFSTTDQPIPSTEVLFNILAPGVVEDHITFGFTRKTGPRGAWSLAILYAPSVSVSGPNPLEAPGLQTIELEMNQWDLEVGYSWGF